MSGNPVPVLSRVTALVAAAGLFVCLEQAAHAQLPPPTAADTASHPAYDPPSPEWTTGDNGGFGMGPWTLNPASNTPQNGFFVGNSIGNNGMSGDSNGDGDINTIPGPRAWGLYANSSQTASAVRNFVAPFTPGSVFEIYMDNGDVQVGGTVGFALRNGGGQELLEVYFVGGSAQYTVHGDVPILSGVNFTREGVRVVITLTTASTYQATLTRLVDGAGNTVSGNLRNNPGPISQLRLFNANAGAGSGNDLFFNRITYYRGRVLNADTGRGYLNIQPAIDDPATLAGHTISVSAGLYTGTQNNNIVINKPRLTLVGAGPTATIISRTASGTLKGIEIAPFITGTTVSSLRVQGFNDGGICAMQDNHFTTITNTHVYSNTGVNCLGGIYLNGIGGINHVTISHNEAVNNTSRGIVIWNGFKTNITITHNLARNNNCCGIELQDGTASGVLIAHNTVRDNFDNGIGTVGLTAGAGPNLIYSNTLINNGRFGIEVKLPGGSGLPTGDGSVVVLSNTVALTDAIATIKPGELRDLAGIAAFRRGWVAGNNNVDIPAGVIIQGNVVSGYQQPSASDGFGIVVEGARMTVISNTLESNDVGVQVQAGHTPYAPFTNTDGDQSNLADQYFGRGNSPVACAFYQAGNVFTGNLTNTRQVGPVTPGTVTNLNTGQTFCGIQQAIDAPPTLGGHVLSLTGDTFTGTVIARKPVVIVGAGPGQTVIQSLSPGVVVTTSNVTISNTSIIGTGSDTGITTTFGVTNLTVSNVHISNFAQGVALLGGHSHTVQNSVFTLTNVITSVGVGMTGLTTTLPITNVLVSGNVFTSSGYAVVGIFASQNVITGNQMRHGIAGVRLAGANGNLIEGNQIEDNSSYAVYLAPNAPPLIPSSVLFNSNNVISGNVALNHPSDRGIQIINGSQPGNGNQIVNNLVQNAGGEGIFLGAGSGDTNLLIAGNTVISAGAGVFVGSSAGVTVSGNTITDAVAGLVVASSNHVSVTANNLLTNATGFSLTNAATNLVTATLNILSGNGTGVLFNSGNAGGLLLTRNAIAGNGAGVTNTAAGTLNAECNWYGAADGPSGAGSGIGDSVSTGVDFNPWLTSNNLNGPCSSGSLTIQKVLVGPITPTAAWQFTATVPTGTLVFTLPAGGGAVTFGGLDFGAATITETAKLGYGATSSCTTGATGGAAISFSLVGDVTCTFTNTIAPATTVITVTPAITNGWAYITETVGPGTGLLPFDIVLPPPDPTLGEASARLVITDVNWRHMYVAPLFTGTLLSDITAFEYRLRIPSASPQVPYINIGWDDDVTDSNTGFRGRLVYSPPSLAADAWHIVDARNDPTPRWYTTLPGAPQCTSLVPCTFAQVVAAYPNAAIHPNTLMGVPLGFVGIRAGGGSSTGTGYADGLRVGVGSQITLFDFEAAPPTTVTLTADPTATVVGNNVLLTATVTIANGDPAADGTVVSFTTSLGNVSPVTATTSGGVVTATLSSTLPGVATVTATVGSLNATALVTFTPGAPFTLTLIAVPTTLPVGNSSALTATATDQYGNPVADGTVVSFTTSLGTLSSGTATTGGGNASVTLSSTVAGVATVTATVGSLSATTQVTFARVFNMNTGLGYVGIQQAIDDPQTLNGHTISVTAGIYTELVSVTKQLTLLGAQHGQDAVARTAAFTGGKADSTLESIIYTPINNPTGGNPGAADLFRVLTHNVTIDGFVFDGNNPALLTSTVQIEGVDAHARRGVTNIGPDDSFNPLNNLILRNNVFQNLGDRGVSLDNNGPASTGNLIERNVLRRIYDRAIILVRNAYADVVSNTIDVPVEGVGLWMQTFYSDGSMAWLSNTITIMTDAFGIHVNNLFNALSATVVIRGNVVNAAVSLAPEDADLTWGINVWSVFAGWGVLVEENRVGLSGGRLGRGINVWNVPTTNTVRVIGNMVTNSTVGVNFDNVDPYYGGGQSSTLLVTGNTITGTADGIGLRVRVSVLESDPLYASNVVSGHSLMVISNTTVTSASVGLRVETGITSTFMASATLHNSMLRNNGTGIQVLRGALTATHNYLLTNTLGVTNTGGAAVDVRLNRNAIVGNSAGITNTAAGTLNAECNWYGAADGPSGVGSGSGDSVSTGVDFNPWLLSDNLNGSCNSGSLTVQKVLVGPITPTTAWQFTATVPTGTLVFTLPAGGGAITFSSLDFGPATITETTKLGYVATSSCTTGATGGASIAFSLLGDVTCIFTNALAVPTTITLSADPSSTVVNSSVLLTATVSDQFGNPVTDGTVVSFTSSLGGVSPISATTVSGVATATLSSTAAGVATVTATVGSLNATALVTFTPGAPFTFTFTLTPTVIVANGISQSVGTATVVDQYGNPVGGVTVNFLAGVGSFSPASGATNAGGQVTATLTSLTPAIENVFAVVSGLGFGAAQATYVNPPASSAPLTSTLQTVTQTLGVVRKGGLITYTLTITNVGAGQINNVLIYAPIPSGTTYVAGSASGGNYSGSFAMLLSGQELGEGMFGPQAMLNAVTWAGNLPGGASHTLSYVVQAQILEGQVVNQPKVFVDNADTGINLSSTVDVIAYKRYMPIIRRSP